MALSPYPDWSSGFYLETGNGSLSMRPHINVLWVADFYTSDGSPLLNESTGKVMFIPIYSIQKRLGSLSFTELDVCGYKVPIPDSMSLRDEFQLDMWDDESGAVEDYLNQIGLARSYIRFGKNDNMLQLRITNLSVDTHKPVSTKMYLVSPSADLSSQLTSDSNNQEIKLLQQMFVVHNSLEHKGYDPGFIIPLNQYSTHWT